MRSRSPRDCRGGQRRRCTPRSPAHGRGPPPVGTRRGRRCGGDGRGAEHLRRRDHPARVRHLRRPRRRRCAGGARALRVPTIVVLHTVLVTPSRTAARDPGGARRASASTVVTMTHTARQRLIDHYDVDPDKIRVIPHGAARQPRRPADRRAPGAATGDPDLGPARCGQGDRVGDRGDGAAARPRPAPAVPGGRPDPSAGRSSGTASGTGQLLAGRAQLGVAESVHFDARYLDAAELHRIVQQADVVLLPYDSREQVTSGVLIEAVDGRQAGGLHRLPARVRTAVERRRAGRRARRIPTASPPRCAGCCTEPGLAAQDGSRGQPDRAGPAVAGGGRPQYRAAGRGRACVGTARASAEPAASRYPAPPCPFEHLLRLSDDVGLFEHAEMHRAAARARLLRRRRRPRAGRHRARAAASERRLVALARTYLAS